VRLDDVGSLDNCGLAAIVAAMGYVRTASVELNRGRVKHARTRLAWMMNVSAASLSDYERAPGDPNLRTMSRSRRRLLALLVVLHRRGENIQGLIDEAIIVDGSW
jgi:hypothetical protein